MINNAILTTVIVLMISSLPLNSQETSSQRSRELTIGIGMSMVGIKDNRLSALKYRSWVPTYLIGFRRTKNKTKEEFRLSFKMDKKNHRDRLLNLRFIQPNFSYSLEKKVNGFWIGGVFNHNTLLTFPSSKTAHFNNNPISYTIANSLGPKMSWSNGFELNQVEKFRLEGSVETSLINYVVRPAYAHPYPDEFLQSGTFTPTKEGMAMPLIKSGKVFSIGKFQSFRIVLGLSYFVSNQIKIGLSLQLDYARTADINTSSISSQDILLQMSYRY